MDRGAPDGRRRFGDELRAHGEQYEGRIDGPLATSTSTRDNHAGTYCDRVDDQSRDDRAAGAHHEARGAPRRAPSSTDAHVTALYTGMRALVAELIRRRRQVEQTCDTLTRVLEATSDGFVALDADWRYTYVNEHAGRMFHRDPASLIGKHIWTEFPEGVGQPFHARIRARGRGRDTAADRGVLLRRTTAGSRTAFSRTRAGSRSSSRTSPSGRPPTIGCARASSAIGRCSTITPTRSIRSMPKVASSARTRRARG